MSEPFALRAYAGATRLVSPFARFWLEQRARAGKEDRARLGERFGHAAAPRPAGRLIWLHGASVGEMGVLLQIRAALAAAWPQANFLITTATKTSADLFAQRPPPRSQHLYAPLDTPAAAAAFIAHWRPDLGVLVESELWPNLLLAARAAKVPLALVNASMSPQTRRRWTGQRAAARRLLQAFDVIVAAEQQTAAVLSALCERRIETKANLKLAAPPLHADPEALMALRHACGARPLWLAASTHPGEDEILLAAHERLRLRHPEALLIIAPRHPERGPALAALAHAAPRRAVGDAPNASPVYIADTMGELGLFYAAATVCFLGGSLLPHLRGHNAVEPAKLGSAIIHGPFVGAHAEVFALLAARGGAIEAKDAASIAQAVDALWRDQAAHARQLAAARAAVAEGGAAFEQTIAALRDLVETPPDRASRHARP